MKARIFRSRFKVDEPGTISHITQRAPGKERLFIEEEDYVKMIGFIKKTARKFSLDVYAYVLMPNHVHLFLRQNKKNLKEAMKFLYKEYAEYFNSKYERKGHVFCGRYRQSVCLNESYFFAVTTYTHNNPVKAGLIRNPLDYRWSSIRPYVAPIKTKTFLNYRFVLDMLSKDINKARNIYQRILAEALKIKTKDILEDPEAIEDYKISVNMMIDKLFKTKIADIGRIDVEIGNKIEEFKKIKTSKGPQNKEAKKYLIKQLQSRGYNIKQIAEKIGVSRQTIHKIIG